jgi:glycosyltransferase involved in cell wall biosynthesis
VPSPPSVHVLFAFRDGPYGGGNQFLKALHGELAARGAIEEDPARADVLLVNSHHHLDEAARLVRRAPGRVVVHRVDGPLGRIRQRDHEVDRVLFRFSRDVAAGTVFQSAWSRQANLADGLRPASDAVVLNAPDPALFHPGGRRPLDPERPRLIATSWSDNPRKGFDVYRRLDETLDFARWSMTFVGNSPVRFRNIRMVEPLPSAALAEELRAHDLFVTASRTDPCSNSLLEALHCGLPALALHDGGHPEIVGAGGETFRDPAEIPAKLDALVADHERYRDRIALPSLAEVADRYLAFCAEVAERGPRAVPARRLRAVEGLAGALGHPVGKRAVRAAFRASGGRLP